MDAEGMIVWSRWLRRVTPIVLVVATCAPAWAGPMTPLERSRLVAHLEMTSGWLVDEVAGLAQK